MQEITEGHKHFWSNLAAQLFRSVFTTVTLEQRKPTLEPAGHTVFRKKTSCLPKEWWQVPALTFCSLGEPFFNRKHGSKMNCPPLSRDADMQQPSTQLPCCSLSLGPLGNQKLEKPLRGYLKVIWNTTDIYGWRS